MAVLINTVCCTRGATRSFVQLDMLCIVAGEQQEFASIYRYIYMYIYIYIYILDLRHERNVAERAKQAASRQDVLLHIDFFFC